MPNELQLIVQVAQFEEAKGGLQPIRTYIVRVLGVLEHQVSNLGTTTDEAVLTNDHPVLYQYNTPSTALFFRVQVMDAATLLVDIMQEHAATFRGWQQFPDYLNKEVALMTMLTSGGALLGQMPLPLAERLDKVLQAHGLETKLIQGDIPTKAHKSPLQSQEVMALLIGESYFVSYAFSFEEVGKV